MPLVRCETHGRVYDNSKENGCPLCIEERSMPRAPGKPTAGKASPASAMTGRSIVFLVLLAVIIATGGVVWYRSTHTPEDRAQAVRDSLRALAAGPARPDTTTFAEASDLSPVRRARALRVALEGIVRANRATLLGMREGPFDTAATDRAERRRAQQYAAFVRRWHGAIDRASAGGADFRYAPGTRLGPQMESVTNYLGAALSVMRDMVPREAVKSRADRTADLTAVRGYLNSAGTVLTNLPR